MLPNVLWPIPQPSSLPTSSLARRFSGFYFSWGYSSQIAKQVSSLNKERGYGLPLVGGVGETGGWSLEKQAEEGPIWNRRWMDTFPPHKMTMKRHLLEMQLKYLHSFSVYLFIYWEAAEFQQQCSEIRFQWVDWSSVSPSNILPCCQAGLEKKVTQSLSACFSGGGSGSHGC